MHIYGAQPEVINKLSTQGIHSDVVAKNAISIFAGYEASSSEPGRLDDIYSGSIHTAYADYSAQPNVSLSLEATAGFFEGLQRVPPTAHRGDTKVAPLMRPSPTRSAGHSSTMA